MPTFREIRARFRKFVGISPKKRTKKTDGTNASNASEYSSQFSPSSPASSMSNSSPISNDKPRVIYGNNSLEISELSAAPSNAQYLVDPSTDNFENKKQIEISTQLDDVIITGKIRYKIDIFHDAERCFVRMSSNGSRLYDVVIATALDALEFDIEDLDIDTCCDVRWQFFLSTPDVKLFPTRTLKGLVARGVTHVNPGEKKGAVDSVMNEALVSCLKDNSNEKNMHQIVVLITGDRDLITNIQRLRQSDFKIVLIYATSRSLPNFINTFPPTLSLGIWEDIIDETEMDSRDLKEYSKRLSFQMQKHPSLRSTLFNPLNALNQGSDTDENVIDDTILEPPTMIGDVEKSEMNDHNVGNEENIPNFKFMCAKDLYQFIEEYPNHSINENQLNLFFDKFPHHRHEVGKISNFCQSAKSEGVFKWKEKIDSNEGYIIQILPFDSRVLVSDDKAVTKKSLVDGADDDDGGNDDIESESEDSTCPTISEVVDKITNKHDVRYSQVSDISHQTKSNLADDKRELSRLSNVDSTKDSDHGSGSMENDNENNDDGSYDDDEEEEDGLDVGSDEDIDDDDEDLLEINQSKRSGRDIRVEDSEDDTEETDNREPYSIEFYMLVISIIGTVFALYYIIFYYYGYRLPF